MTDLSPSGVSPDAGSSDAGSSDAGSPDARAAATVTTVTDAVPPAVMTGLSSALVAGEAERDDAEKARASEQVLFADELLPGVGGAEMTLREGLTIGGRTTFLLLMLLSSFDELEGAALGILAPDIRDTFGVSDGTIVFISAASGAFIVFGALPMGWLADRFRRGRIIGWANLVFAAMVFLCGFAVNAFMLFWTRLGVGVAKANNLPVHGSLIADSYPIEVRGRIGSLKDTAGRIVGVLSPLAVGGVAAIAGGTEGWRWAFYLMGIPAGVLAFSAFRLPEPPRGQFEKADVLGEVIEDRRPAPVSVEAAFARLLQIRTLKTALIAFSAMGFGLFTGPVLSNLYLEDRFDLDTFGRGVVATVGGVVVAATLPFVGRYYDRLYRVSPERALALVGKLVLPAALFTPIQFSMPNVALFVVCGIPNLMLLSAAFTMVGPVLQSVVPYRLRGLGSALGAVYIFFIGATGGALVAGLLSNAYGPRVAVIAVGVPSTIIGGALVIRSASFIRNDLSMLVAELQEEMAEHQRQQADPADIPVLQVHDVDFSYGHVQVLFGAGFEVKRGEVLALLGTNGSGKSTLLRVVAGLGTPARGVVRLNGQTITYVSPEQRVRMGVHMLPGGKGVFGQMTVRANLVMGAFIHRSDPADVDRRIERVLGLFPLLADRQDQMAGSLSGGQQQILALARTLLHDPEVLIIDELSLGLSPVLVQELLATIEQLKSEGMTIVVVEQSLNVALAIADRAVFLEKGQVRFVGPVSELAGRDDLARAVFLGREGG
jgi:ABC-type branched-subunit amino acid transport system ATPase component/predicted MFS family arabinose efflux permease